MDPLAFLTWQFVLFSLSVMAVMFVVRTIVEYFIKLSKSSKLWNSLILPIAPIFVGGLMAYVLKMYPYSPGLDGKANHILFGLVGGLLSTIIFKVVKELLGGKISQMVGAAASVWANNGQAPNVVGNPMGINNPMGGTTVSTNTTVISTSPVIPNVTGAVAIPPDQQTVNQFK